MSEFVGTPAFEEVFEDLFVEAYRTAYRILRNHNDAEDAAAETMARALDKWRTVGRSPTPAKWVVRVATNVAFDTVRRRRRAADRGSLPSPAPSTDEDGHTVVVELLSRLPLRQRQVMTLRIILRLSEAEIAERLGISRGTVKRYASRAAEHLRDDEVKAWLS